MAVGKPGSAPTMSWRMDGTTIRIKITSATASSAQRYVYQYRSKSPTGNYGDWSNANNPFGYMDGRVYEIGGIAGYTYQARTRGVRQTNQYDVSYSDRGAWSDTRTLTVPTRPDPVSEVTAVSPDGIIVNATWPAPGNGGSAITGYTTKIRYGLIFEKETKEIGTTRSVTFDGLTPGFSYQVGVAAKNAIGTGTMVWSDHVTMGNVPSAILSVTLNRDGNATWLPPLNGGAVILEYQVQVWDGFEWGETLSTGLNTKFTLSGRRPGVGYKIRVRARNGVGVASWRESNHATSLRCTCTV